MAAGALLMASCTKNEVPAPQNDESIKLNINISGPGNDTKAAKKSWVAGDKLNIWFDTNHNQSTPDLIITYNGTNWVAGSLRAGCTPPASGYLLALYEGFNDVSSAHYDYSYYLEKDWFQPKATKEQPEVSDDSYCRPLVFYAFAINCTFSANTLSFTINTSDWEYHTSFKVLIKTHTLMDKDADYYNLQVTNTTASTHPSSHGAWIIIHDSYEYNIVGNGSANSDGWTGGVQEADGIAFYYSSFTATDANITFTLKEYGGTTRTYSVSGKTIDAEKTDRCVGVAIDYSKFLPKFSVSDTKKVYFSPGNLQYQASTNTWRFAEHQWDYVGNATGNTTTGDDRATQSAWIDLFAWGTSGYDDPSSDHDVYYHPWDNREGSKYGPGAVSGFDISGDNLTGELTKYDWGVFNAIGASPAGTWRTLTADEWQWLLTPKTGDPDPGTNCRTSSTVNGVENARYAKASVNGIKGLIIFPDSYTHPAGVTLPSGINTKDAAYTVNTYSAADWSAIQAAGAVFLPAAGYRYWYSGSDYRIDGNNTYGGYWTRTCGSNNGNAQAIYFSESNVSTYDDRARWTSISVRLIHDID